MKRIIGFLLALSLLLTACTGTGQTSEKNMVQPVKFYYCADLTDDKTDSTAIVWEYMDLGEARLTAEEILGLYLQGPRDPLLISPYPEELEITKVVLSNGLLTINTNDTVRDLAGVQRTLAAACLVRTMTQFAGIQAVRILAAGKELSGGWSGPWSAEDFLLEDDTATSNASTVKLYFSDREGRYLTEESRSSTFDSEDQIPHYILQQLLEGPQDESSVPAIPDGTRLLGVQVSDGMCTVNFSEDFVRNRPESHAQARLAVFSVVNSLTELPLVERVTILSNGQEIPDYAGLDLRQILYREETAFGADRALAQTVDLDVYLPCLGQSRLAEIPVVLRRTEGRSLWADAVSALLSFSVPNVYENPIPEGTMVMGAELEGSLCRVTFSSTFALCDADPAQARLAIRSVVATLCALDEVDQVVIEIQNGKLTSVDLSEPLSVQPFWLLP